MKKPISRRAFLQTVSATTLVAPLIVPRLSFASPPSSRLQHGAIGVAGQGDHDLGSIFSSDKVDVVALCDIDATRLERAHAKYPKARLYRDWRDMLEKEEKNLDSVNVSTPDHTHAVAAMTAIRKGLAVYCEKPLTHDVVEARRLTLAAREAGVVTQMGNQIHSHEYYRTAVHWMKEGAIGKIKTWHSWASASFTTPDKKRPAGSDKVPKDVDWDLWLGTAPERPYKKEAYHPFNWRCYRDFGGGATGDFGCHIFDTVFTALGIGAPLSVVAEAESVSDEVYPAWTIAHYVFPGVDLSAGKTIEATWYDGGKQPKVDVSPHLPADLELPSSGSIVIGEDGTMLIPHVGAPKLYPLEKFASYPKPSLEPIDHYHEFVHAALGSGVVPGSNFDYAGPLTEAVQLANIANRYPGQTLEWDPEKMTFKNFAEADKHLERKYRRGWKTRGL